MKKIKRAKKVKITKIKILIFILTILVIILLFFIANMKKNNIQNTEQNEKIVFSEPEKEKDKIKDYNERRRIQYYIGKYLKYVESEKYIDAYELLNKDFVNNYFPDFSQYVEYMSKNYESDFIVEYTNFERLGDLYVVWTNIINPLTDSPADENKNEQIFVVKENDLADFELSFNVKEVEE